MRTALTIAGSDSSGGAGIQADIKTMMANGVFAMSAITAMTAQNTTGVTAIMDATPEFLKAELDEVFTDIFPDAVKIGMVSKSSLIRVIAERLRFYKPGFIVVDPVMVATSGAKLISDEAVRTLREELLPLATILTPNIPETEVLSGMEVRGPEDMIRAAEKISRNYHCAVLCKGGHNVSDANDLLYRDGSYRWFYGKRIDNPNTHGTGCTLSSAIASNLAKGFDLDTSVERAKAYISGALGAMLDLGHGSGPMNHSFAFSGRFMEMPDAAEEAWKCRTRQRRRTHEKTDPVSVGPHLVRRRRFHCRDLNRNVLRAAWFCERARGHSDRACHRVCHDVSRRDYRRQNAAQRDGNHENELRKKRRRFLPQPSMCCSWSAGPRS